MNRKFLLADDDADDASLFCEALTTVASTIECYTAENGIELFDLLSKHQPDFIFLDINMPLMNGWDCLRKLKNNPTYETIPIIMYSTSAAPRDIHQAYDLGVTLFMTKPEDFNELSSILKTVATTSKDALLTQLKEFPSVKMN